MTATNQRNETADTIDSDRPVVNEARFAASEYQAATSESGPDRSGGILSRISEVVDVTAKTRPATAAASIERSHFGTEEVVTTESLRPGVDQHPRAFASS
jgi:hypothetical protein